ncbi:gliding motility-associated C-terminal domain-containing protein [Chitinophaga sp. Cy-1792]|uniref:gliding motility-associated C-terminal domain-containing protein n=1 Tax=Chitinophaga sp. Cy-1792 TaxID=2608339 RepID=UPI0014228D56|nr:gliding motility-associated C-terminal domain-containing protein [Chitinophaga sp. Cy-1792]NIG56008.1 gliding motility-associated C-terminal domain-containing protein [Chitinophaga sp. Cy-1792]
MNKLYRQIIAGVLLMAGILPGQAVKAATSIPTSIMMAAVPPSINDQTFTVHDDTPAGSIIGQVVATGNITDWIIIDDNSNGAITLSNNGTLTVKDANMLKSKHGTTIRISVSVSDGVFTSDVADIKVTVVASSINHAPTLDPIANQMACSGTDLHTMQLTGMSAGDPDQTYTLVAVADLPVLDLLQVTTDGILTWRLKPGQTQGSCTVTVIIKDDGGTANGGQDTKTETFTISINKIPDVRLVSDKGNIISKGDIITLTASGGDTYKWIDGVTEEVTTASITAKPTKLTTYQVVAISNQGCTDTASIEIRVLGNFVINANNVLTPNGDGHNDYWVINGIEDYPENELTIVDRGGRIVYSQKNYHNTWDGKVNGQQLAEGTYYYVFRVNSTKDVAKGYITIIRNY